MKFGAMASMETRASALPGGGLFDDEDGFLLNHGIGTVSCAKPRQSMDPVFSETKTTVQFSLNGMAATQLDNNGAEFLVNLDPKGGMLDGLLVVFGKVTEGIDVSKKIAAANLHLSDDGLAAATPGQWSYIKASGELDADGDVAEL